MAELTPPSSHSGTPVKSLRHPNRQLPSPSQLITLDDGLKGESSSSPEREMDMEELVGTDGSEVDEGMDQDREEDHDHKAKGVRSVEGDLKQAGTSKVRS